MQMECLLMAENICDFGLTGLNICMLVMKRRRKNAFIEVLIRQRVVLPVCRQ